jgi:F-type H+-transporting ATPase subunit a
MIQGAQSPLTLLLIWLALTVGPETLHPYLALGSLLAAGGVALTGFLLARRFTSPLIGTAALFVFFGNLMALIPGMPVPTSSLNITLGSALVVFVLFNAYGLMTNGFGYVKHLAGPAWYLAPLMFPIEVISLCVRPVTLAVRLMVNMAADHLMLGLFMSLVALFVPIPLMILGCLVVLIQTLVFTMLTCIYIGLATEREAHGPGHAHH